MRFIIATLGTEGDIRPFIALARELEYYNHEVAIATTENHFWTICNFGIECIKIGNYNGRSPVFFNIKLVRTVLSTLINEKGYLEELWNLSRDADVLIYNVATFPCIYIAEKLGIPCFGAFLQPHHATRSFPDPSVTNGKPWRGIFNLLGFWLFDFVHWQYVRSAINQWRKDILKLPAIPLGDTILKQLEKRRSYILYS